MKTLQVTHGPHTETVAILGVLANAKLTPTLAKMAARIACGHCDGVTVMDGDRGYRIYSEKKNSHRKITMEEDNEGESNEQRRI